MVAEAVDRLPGVAHDAPSPASAVSPGVPVGARSIQRLAGRPPALTAARSPRSAPDAVSAASPTAASPPPVPVRRNAPRGPESVPPSVRADLEPQFGESLSDVRIHRGPDVGDAARSMSAKAFASDGEVFLPGEHGPVTSGEGRAILAHELTHVVQQRRLGGRLPAETSPDGARLEREALEVGGQTDAPVVARQVPVVASGATQRLVGTMPPRSARPLAATRAAPPTDLTPGDQAAMVARIQAAAVGAGIPTSSGTSGSGSAAPGRHGPVAQRLAASVASTATPTLSATSSTGPAPAPTIADAPTSSTSSTSSNPSNPSARSANDLDELAGQLYPRFRSRLRGELLADRERSGRLFDR